jgi:hypothetical protein
LVILGGDGTFKRWGLVEGLQVIGGVFLEETVEPEPFPVSPFHFQAIG